MVEKITIFEPHFDGAHFGPIVNGNDDTQTEEAEVTPETENTNDRSSGSVAKRIFGLVLLGLIVGGIAYAMRHRSSEFEEEFETTEAEPISVEQ